MVISNQKITVPDQLQQKISIGSKNECERHGTFKKKSIILPNTQIVLQGCPQCCGDEILRREKAERKQKILKLFDQSNIPKRFRGSTIDGYIGNNKGIRHAGNVARNYVNEFEKIKTKGTSLIFCGGPGTGKTHLACAIAIELINRGIGTLYITEYKVLRTVKNTWRHDSGSTEETAIHQFVSPELLIIDEIGVSFGAEADKTILYQIINSRYERLLPTIAVSNLTLNELINYIGERIVDRLKEGAGVTVAFDWESYRR